MSVMTYDYHGSWENVTGYVSPLYAKNNDRYPQYNTNYTMNYLVSKGAPREKLLVSIPFYGHTYTLVDGETTSENEAADSGPGEPGEYTNQPGMLAYYEVCDKIKNKRWTLRRVEGLGPCAFSKTQWVSFEDPQSVKEKARYIRSNGFGGAVAWTVDVDDFNNKCCRESFPLLKALHRGLGLMADEEVTSNCNRPAAPLTPEPPKSTTGFDTSAESSTWDSHHDPDSHTSQKPSSTKNPLTTTENDSPSIYGGVISKPFQKCTNNGVFSNIKDCAQYFECRDGVAYQKSCSNDMLFNVKTGSCDSVDPINCRPGQQVFFPSSKPSEVDTRLRASESVRPKVVCYITSWSFYRKSDGKFVPENIDPKLCTHVVYAFAILDSKNLTITEFDSNADLDNNLYRRVTSIRGVTSLLGIGGWIDSAGNKYSRLVRREGNRHKFITNVIVYLKRHGFNGLHFDWNYPVCWQSNCRRGPDSDKSNFVKLIKELKDEFDEQDPPLVLAASISGYKEVIDDAYDIPALSSALDFMSVMTYDYHGSWENVTGYVSPLYAKNNDRYPQYNTNYTMNYLVSKGAPREKLLVSIPFYGHTYTLVDGETTSENEAADSGPGEPGEYTNQPGMLAYYEVCDKIKNKRWTLRRVEGLGPCAFSKKQWVSFEDPQSVKEKARYIRSHGFGGAVAWTVDVDDFNNKCCRESFPLLKALHRGLGLMADEEVTSNCNRPAAPLTPEPPKSTTGFDTSAESSTWDSHHDHDSHTSQKPSTTKNPLTTTKQSTNVWWELSTDESTSTEWWKPSTSKKTTTTSKTTTPWRVPSSSRPTKTTTKKPNQTKPTPAAGDHKPEKCYTNQYKSDPYNCNAYYRCIQGEFSQLFCAGGLHWNNNKKVCDWPAAAKCKEISAQAPSVSTTTQRTTSKMPTTSWWEPSTQSTKPPKKCETGQYYPHEHCDSFYVCVNGLLLTQKCGPGLYWNAADSRCDWRFRAKCIEGAASEALDRYTKVPAGSATNIQSSCSSGSYSALKGSCEKYLYCLWGKYELFACSSGLHWNKEKNVCDWPQNAKCSESSENPDIDNINEVNHEHPTSRPTVKPSTSKPKPKPTTSTSTTTRKPWEWKPESTTANQWDWKPTKPTFTTTTAEPPAVPYEPLSGYFKIVCYFTNWAWYRQGVGKYVPENINPDLCTHIVYGFAVLDTERLVIKAHDSWADFDNYFYERVVEFKKAGKKVTLAIGGWNDSLGDKYSRLVNNPSARARFIQHVIEFLEKHNFDGLDLDWEYPKCWQVDCKKGPDSDKPAFAAFVKELKEAFKPKSLLLSAAVSPSKTVIDAGYDVATVAKYLDWIAVMTYDFHGQWDKQTGHVAPLYVHPEDENVFFNANFSINYWISQGAPRRKIIMGMPLYGQSFQLEKADNHGLNAKAPGPGQAGEFTRAAGFLAYYEICNKIKKEGWTVVQDPKRRMGPYAYKGNQWVSYDDQEQIRIKSEYIRKMDLGGGMIWALDLDDFNNRCGEGKHPLLSIIRRVLAKPGSGAVEVPQYVKPELPDSDKETTELTQEIPKRPGVPDVSLSTSTPSLTEPNSEYKVICYFTNWAWYRPGVGRYLPGNVDPNLCTHLVYGFAILDEQQMTIKIHDTWTDIENDFYGKITKYRKNGIKVLIAIGGWNDSEGDKYSRLVNDPEARKKFIENVVQFIEEHNFDGLDLDWEYPKCWQGDCRLGPASDKPAFAEFVRELKEAFSPKNFLLSSAVSPSSQIIDVAYDVPELSKYLDWIGIMNYDYHGQWDKVTGHVSPMYVSEDDADITFNTNYSVNYWIEQGADRRKLILGMPTYGQSFTLSDPSQNSLNAPSAGGGEAGEHTRAMGFLAYYEICNNILKRGWNVVRDPEGRMGPYAYSGNQWVSFDDTNMIRHKAEYIKRMGLGGGMIWALDLDDFSNYCGCEKYPLLRTINRVLRNYPIPPPKCNLESNVVTTGDESTPSPTDSDNGGSDEELVCDGSQIFMSHSTNCNQYYLCNQGMYELQTCPSGLYWNVKNCDWPENTPCSSTNSVNGAKLYRRKGSENFVEGQIDVSNDGYKVVCYFANWAWYRQHPGKYTPEDIDASLCTHIIYGFAVLDSESLTIKPYDNWTDIDNDLFRKVAALRTKGVKVSIALGSWNDSLGDKYSRLVSNAQYRTRFVENVIQFIEKWNFNGLDLHWMYPKCWQMDCEKGPDTDKIGFGELIEELSLEFKPRGLLLSAAVSPNKTVIDAAYDVPKLDMYLDWMTVRDYDIFGSWDSQSGPLGRLYRYSRDQDNNYNSNFSLNYWIQKGASPNKLIMDIPFYGYSFTLANSRNNVLNVTSVSPGTAGQFTKAEGFLAFYEICDMINNEKDWKVIHDPAGRIGSNATKEYQWMSYDDISDIKRISEYLKDMGLGGAMVWSLDLDDFRNRCGCGDYPLLKTVNYVLRGFPLTTTHENCT
ncbi:probable chitinase 10 [Agrilus planipennis]|uniref:chitinase n=1 Tax=Agrilus planipennis TaxID=224129 RepID=A0A7F5RJX2_AGRPL|nr:probable chitinase 10 [Agrilus planipennis]